MNRKLIAVCAALLLSLCPCFSVAAGGWWYYDGAVGRWRVFTSREPQKSGMLRTSEAEIAAASHPTDCLRKQWFQDPDDRYWYYLDRDGWMLTGLQELDGIRYRFRNRPDQGNYLPDTDDPALIDEHGTGFYSYRANGRPTYGSLEEILGEPEHDAGGDSERRQEEDRKEQEKRREPEKLQELKATASERPKTERSSASDLPRPDQKASASDISPTDPGAENERRQELEEDEQVHSHIDRDEDRHCIAYDLWSRILQHPLDYKDCFENRCTSRLYLTGAAISLPGEDTPEAGVEDRTLHIPLYVSLLRSPSDSEGHFELVQAYAVDALFLPMHTGVEDSNGTEPRGNAGGAGESLPWSMLNGGTYRWTEASGPEHSEDYEGFRLCSREREGYAQLPLEETVQLGSRGFLAETQLARDGWQYLGWRDGGFTGSGEDISFLCRTTGSFRFLSEQNLFGTAAASLPLPLKGDRYYPAAEDTWRSADSYWLGSTPCSGMFVADREELLDDLYPAMTGPVAQLDYTAAGRHYLLYDAEAALDDALFEDPARADRRIGAAETTERQMLRLRFSLAAGK